MLKTYSTTRPTVPFVLSYNVFLCVCACVCAHMCMCVSKKMCHLSFFFPSLFFLDSANFHLIAFFSLSLPFHFHVINRLILHMRENASFRVWVILFSIIIFSSSNFSPESDSFIFLYDYIKFCWMVGWIDGYRDMSHSLFIHLLMDIDGPYVGYCE